MAYIHKESKKVGPILTRNLSIPHNRKGTWAHFLATETWEMGILRVDMSPTIATPKGQDMILTKMCEYAIECNRPLLLSIVNEMKENLKKG